MAEVVTLRVILYIDATQTTLMIDLESCVSRTFCIEAEISVSASLMYTYQCTTRAFLHEA